MIEQLKNQLIEIEKNTNDLSWQTEDCKSIINIFEAIEKSLRILEEGEK